MTQRTAAASPGEPDHPALMRTSRHHRSQSEGSVEGYRVSRTLPLRAEFGRQLRRRRTRITLGFLAVLPWLLLLAFELGNDGSGGESANPANIATSSGLNFAVFALFASTNFLLVVVVALFFGDTVAGEASWSSLKYLLAAPVPRTRLLRQKAIVSAVLSLFAVLLFPAMALAVGSLWYGTGELINPDGEALAPSAGLLSLAGASVYLGTHLLWIAGLALWLSVSTDAPLGAVGSAVLVSILSQILDEITALGNLRAYLPTHYSMAWSDLLSDEVDWTAMVYGTFSGLAYATVFSVLAVWHFSRKDISG